MPWQFLLRNSCLAFKCSEFSQVSDKSLYVDLHALRSEASDGCHDKHLRRIDSCSNPDSKQLNTLKHLVLRSIDQWALRLFLPFKTNKLQNPKHVEVWVWAKCYCVSFEKTKSSYSWSCVELEVAIKQTSVIFKLIVDKQKLSLSCFKQDLINFITHYLFMAYKPIKINDSDSFDIALILKHPVKNSNFILVWLTKRNLHDNSWNVMHKADFSLSLKHVINKVILVLQLHRSSNKCWLRKSR